MSRKAVETTTAAFYESRKPISTEGRTGRKDAEGDAKARCMVAGKGIPAPQNANLAGSFAGQAIRAGSLSPFRKKRGNKLSAFSLDCGRHENRPVRAALELNKSINAL